jgi:hypothetical protein
MVSYIILFDKLKVVPIYYYLSIMYYIIIKKNFFNNTCSIYIYIYIYTHQFQYSILQLFKNFIQF